MRLRLLYDPFLLSERIAEFAVGRRRLRRLRGTAAASLELGHIDSLELLELLSPTPNVIYDIGANVGTWTMLAHALYPNAQIHAFEPLPSHHAAFHANTASSNATLHPVALGAVAARRELHVLNLMDASSFLPLTEAGRQTWHLKETGSTTFTIEPLDDWVETHRLPLPDLIKLDVQGFELEVLRGAERCVKAAKAVLSEVSFREFYAGQALFSDLVSFMASAGLRVHAFGATTAVGRPVDQCDVLFVRA